ncbi:hypothetical protein [Natrinema versiforme]|uniref:Uncharacterized protein n=1 Tax=Natrinema versiforme TaxID=88724 RepID=A0A4P8WM49_9EURY|nr:hypothetical protein [Natrinema versiforme]QCS44639.1 hypothetical protein FEJ81_20225 [Natrinema versiforme]
MNCPFCDEFNNPGEDRVKDHMVDSHRSELPSFTDSMNCQREDCGGTVPAGARRCNLNDHDHARYFAGIKLTEDDVVTHINGRSIDKIREDGYIPEKDDD